MSLIAHAMVHEEFIMFSSNRKDKLVDTFSEQVQGENFSFSYFEKPGNSKCCIESAEDLKAIYKTYRYVSTIDIWL